MTENLFKKLYDYSCSDIYPFCMPGHKRRFSAEYSLDPYRIDITEVDGFDDLQKCTGILGDIQNDLCAVYGCANVFMSVNGSSACNLAAIWAMPENGRIAVASNCHRSVFNALKINRRKGIFIDPAAMPSGLKGGISPEEVNSLLNEYPDICAVAVTSPTYEGFVSDVNALANVCHSHGALLIVDEAHGAHLPFCSSPSFPLSAICQGADIVIESLHKTLPALNQTSLIFVPNDDVLAKKVKECLNMVMTTSPSYILMASVQEAVMWSHLHREEFDRYAHRITALRQDLSTLEKIHLVDNSVAGNYNILGIDPGKLVFAPDTGKSALNGKALFTLLQKRYSLALEKYEDGFALAMTSVMDSEEGLRRLADAIFDIEKSL